MSEAEKVLGQEPAAVEAPAVSELDQLGAQIEKAVEEQEQKEADQKPEEKVDAALPAVKADDQKADEPAVVEQAKQEDDEAIPDKPDKNWFIKERQKRKELKAEYEAQLKALQDRLQAVEEAAKQPAKETEKKQGDVNPAEIFRLHARAKLGEFQGDPAKGMSAEEQNALVLKHAQSAIEREFDVDEIEKVLIDASDGKFGPYSAEIAEVAKSALPLAMRREQKSAMEMSKQQALVEEMRKTAQAELEQVVVKYPQFKDQTSDEYKHVAKWNLKWVGEIDPKTGRITKPGLLDPEAAQRVLTHPAVHAELVLQDLAAEKYRGTLAQKQRLESSIVKSRQPESGGRPSSSSAHEPGSSNAILAELEARTGIKLSG